MDRHKFERWNGEFPFLEEALRKLNRSPHQLSMIQVRKYDKNVLAMIPETWHYEAHGEKGVYMDGHRLVVVVKKDGDIRVLRSPPEKTLEAISVGLQLEGFSGEVAFIVEFLKHQFEIELTQICVTIYKDVSIDPSHLHHV